MVYTVLYLRKRGHTNQCTMEKADLQLASELGSNKRIIPVELATLEAMELNL